MADVSTTKETAGALPAPGPIPLHFLKTVIEAGATQTAAGLDTRATVIPPAAARRGLAARRTAEIPVENIARGGKRIRFDARGAPCEAGPVDFGHYELTELLGYGGMGVVCAARQVALRREVALKVARGTDEGSAGEALANFIAEAQITAGLDHPNVVPVHTLARDDTGRVYFTMKRVRGVSWGALLGSTDDDEVARRAAAMTLDDHLEILLRVGDAVAFAHSKLVLHRDLKPDNVMIGAYGEVLLMDWGLAMHFGPENPYLLDPTLEPRLSGTPVYMAPEMARGELATLAPSTDVYLLGAILYELLCGRPPHVGLAFTEVVARAAEGEVVPPEQVAPDRRITPELSAIVMRALAPRMEDRYQTVKELQEALRGYRLRAESLTVVADAERSLAGLRQRAGRRALAGGDHRPQPPGEQAAVLYGELSELIGAFRQALKLWTGNERARAGLLEALTLQIRLALAEGDLNLARVHLQGLAELAGQGEEGWRARVSAEARSLGESLERQVALQAAAARRARRHRVLVIIIVATVLASIAGGVVLLARQRQLAVSNLGLARAGRQLAQDNLRLGQRMQRRLFAHAVQARAELFAMFLESVEAVTDELREDLEHLLASPAAALPPAPRTAAGRDGFYLDEDFYDPARRPADAREDSRYGLTISKTQGAVVLAGRPTGAARQLALEDARRLGRLAAHLAQTHRPREDLLWTVAATTRGAKLTFPGVGLYRDKPDYDPTSRPWFKAALASTGARPRWNDPHVDSAGRGLILSCGSPLKVGGARVGAVAVELGLDQLQAHLTDFLRTAGKEARGLLVRRDGGIVIDSRYAADPQRWKERFVVKNISELPQWFRERFAAALRTRTAPDEAAVLVEGRQQLYVSHAWLPHPDWVLLVAAPSAAVGE